MAIPGSLKIVCAILALTVVFHAVALEAAVTCNQVTTSLAPCFPYIKGAPRAVSPACCNGLRSIVSGAKTTPDRQAICKCVKTAASSVSGINFGMVGALLGKCRVNLPYKITPSTNCDSLK